MTTSTQPQQPPQQPNIPSYATPSTHKPAPRRVNVRLFVFLAVILCLLGLPLYIYLDSVFTGGIKNHGDRVEVDLKAMSNFPFDQANGTANDIPQQFRALDGKRIEVTGEIWSPNSAGDGIDRFDLVYSIAKCCFNGPPQVQHFVKAHAKSDPLPYYNGLVRVVGTLHINVKRDPEVGKVTQVYELEVESVQQG